MTERGGALVRTGKVKKTPKVKKFKHPCIYAKAHYASHLITLTYGLVRDPVTGGINFRMVPEQFHEYQIINLRQRIPNHIAEALESYSKDYDRRLDWPLEKYIHSVVGPSGRKRGRNLAPLKLAYQVMVYDPVHRCGRCPYCDDLQRLSDECDCESCQKIRRRLTDPTHRSILEEQFRVIGDFEEEERDRGVRVDIFHRVGSDLRDILGRLRSQEDLLRGRGIVDDRIMEQIRILSERLESIPEESATTACFDCTRLVPVEDSWSPKEQPTIALCDPCFRIREVAGRAREADVEDRGEEFVVVARRIRSIVDSEDEDEDEDEDEGEDGSD